VIVKTLLLEFKSREISEYPDALINASAALMMNTSVMPTFIKGLFMKTNVYDF
jgi:hypothetical protein